MVAESGSTASSTSNGAAGSNFIVNLAMAGSMSQLWGLIESLQIVSYIQLFDAKTPGNVQSFLRFFETMTAFEILPAEEMTESLLYVVESEPPSVNFQQAGFDSSFLVNNLGSMFYIMVAYVGLYAIFFLVVWPLS